MWAAGALRLALLILTPVLLCACSKPAEPPGTINGNSSTYVHSMDGAPVSLDPAQANSIYANFVVVNLYDTLYRYRYLARPYELAPNLAEALPEISADGLEFTIRLRRGVRFIDDPAFPDGRGREVTAGDVIYSLLRHFDPASRAQGGWLWAGRIEGLNEWQAAGADYQRPVSGLTALDTHTLRIRLSRPYPQLVHTLAQGYAAVVPREAVTAYGVGLGTHAVGSGPYRLLSFDSARAVLERNPDYRPERLDLAAEGYDPTKHTDPRLPALDGQPLPLTSRIRVEFIAEDAARWNALLAGDTHFAKIPASQFERVLATRTPPALIPDIAERFEFALGTEPGFVYTNFNLADPAIGRNPDPEQDRRNRALRCAIVKAFDWQEHNRRFFSDLGAVFGGVLVPVVPEFDPVAGAEYARHDPDGARRLLAENGWHAGNLPRLEYGFPVSVTERQIFEQIRSYLVEVGYPPQQIQPLGFATYGDYARAYSQGRVMLITSSWTMDYPDAQNLMQLYYGPNAAPGSNSANYANPEYDRLFEAASTMPESPARTALYRKMNAMLMEDCAMISGLSRNLLTLWNRQAVMVPDRSFVGGYFFRFVALDPALAE